ncbi:nascent polypeptide-associated complex subunit alpha, muscle-specific form-like [Hypomesus transpacificus]|uniref:nascent polypeptide-associated complex subunit alpha, muscle-specific form-like n=1 Tax=Hypomesus transpacificus TaxID=137520 RepID=UPI001F07CF30|nr:nascent polypeptide-associated complex subunit alpha, muscle-specific form-like [Hypomesus transpacificus]
MFGDLRVKEWLCLTCQMQRTVGGMEPPGPPKMKPQPSPNKTSTSATPQKKETSTPGSPQRKTSSPAVQPPKTEAAKGLQSQKSSPAPVQKSPQDNRRTSGPQKPPDQTSQTGRKQSNAAQQESGGFFGFGGAKSQPAASQPAESVSGKMFGFGSSIFSSASTLITSAVQDEPRPTPPASPKVTASAQASPKMPPAKETKPLAAQKAEEKKPEQPQQTKAPPSEQAKVDKTPSEPPKSAAASQPAPKAGQSTCPLCKVGLNVGSKDPPNYNTCTQCKNIVCNQCGFNPMPHETQAKEWLCLTCQTQRAVGGMEPPGPLMVKPQPSPNKTSTNAAPQKSPSTPGSPQRKPSSPAVQPPKTDAAKGLESQKQGSPGPVQKSPQDNRRTSGPLKPPDQTSQPGRKQSNAAQQESGGFFGFGGAKSQPAASQPAESVSGKMFGFGSSIFSSASTLITSAVQDEPRPTPPSSPKVTASAQASPKMPPAKETKPPAAQKAEEKKPEQPQQTKAPPSEQAKMDKTPSEPPKSAAASQPAPKAGQSTCPLCKVGLNVGSKDPPNYNTCTQCKNTVCNLCGFNPMPHETQAKEWLCLTCQTQRAVGGMEPPGPPIVKPQPSPNKTSTNAAPQKAPSTPGSPQRKPSSPAVQPPKTEAVKGLESQKQASPTPVQKSTQDNRRTSGPQKPPDQTSQPGRKQSNAAQQESGGLFGLGGAKSQPAASQPAESVSGKMFGFGSSIFSSASTLITSAVQDEPRPTPPASPKVPASAQASPKMPLAKETKPLSAQKAEEKKPEQPQQTKAPPSEQAKVDKTPSELPKSAAASQPAPKAGQSTCPLCKVGLNVGSKDPPNYNTCTQCKNTVCNLCGFNPMPHETQAKEWLCLTCQTQRAVGGMEPPGPPMVKLQPSPNKTSTNAAPQKAPSTPGSPQRKPSSPAVQPPKTEAVKGLESQKQASPTPIQKSPQDNRRTSGPQKPPDQTSQPGRKQSNAAQQESGGFFGFGGAKSQPAASQPAESVSGKMFGFGSSIFSSASTLITSAVQDEPRPTPPASPKVSAAAQASPKMPLAKETKPLAAQKAEQRKPEQPQPTKAPPSEQAKMDKTPSEPPKSAAASQPALKTGQSTCPLCKVGLNVGSKDPPNYNTWSPQRKPTSPAVQPPKAEAGKGLESQKQGSPTPVQKSPQDNRRTSGPQKPPDQTSLPGRKQSNAAQQESGGFFGLGGAKSQPAASQPAESVSGKMFGFGSSIFSSASTLITSAVQDEPRPTPPASPKVTASAQASPKMPPAKDTKTPAAQKAEEMKPEQPQQTKAPPSEQAKMDKTPSEPPKSAAASQPAPKAGQSTCPLCKVGLNVGSKDPPNYNTCTQCKNTVCNQCGFNPIPQETKIKEWLCLTCQTQRAVGAIEPPGTPMMKPQPMSNKVSTAADPEKKDTTSNAVQEKVVSTPGSPQRKPSSPAVQPPKAEVGKGLESQKQGSPTPVQKLPQDNRRTSGPQKPPDQTSQQGRKQSNAFQQESGGFFGLGGAKSQPAATQPAESVSGKMFGFGSSIFSSASTLITSSVQDEPRPTPPASPKVTASAQASPKMPLAKETKPPANQKAEEKKPEQPQQTNDPPSEQAKVDKTPSEPPKSAAASQPAPKAGQSTCPLCKVGLNVGSKDPPNYNTCTQCKNSVCNQCGFTPMPQVSETKEWLCLTCQMQRAVGGMEPPGPPKMKPQASPNNTSTSATPQKKETSTPGSPQRKPSSPAVQPPKAEATKGLESQKQGSPVPVQKSPQDNRRTSGPQKPPDQTSQPGRKQSNAAQQESGGFFGFGGAKSQPAATQPAESVSGKMFGFGSSIFSSASTLITSAVQDEPRPTPPASPKVPASAQASPKMPPAKETKPPAFQKAEEKKPEQPQLTKALPSEQAKVDKTPSEPPKSAAASQPAPKAGQSTCPLCKVGLNVGSKDPPNYNTCTQCKNSVCNQCGFTPMPQVSEVKEWLCLTCQMERAVGGMEASGASSIKSQPSPNKVATAATSQKKETSTPGSPQRKTSSPAVHPPNTEAAKGLESQKQGSLAPVQKSPQDNRRTSGPLKPADQTSQPGRKQSNAAQQESGGFFGFGGAKSQPAASQPSESVSGKMFGFGSSIFSSASTLITSAVQDEPRPTPPASPKVTASAQASPMMPPAKDTKTPAAQKAEVMKPEQPQQIKAPPSEQAKVDKTPSEPPKSAAASQPAPKAGQSTCPLCKVGLNVGSKDPPNYNTCTQCKKTVCNQCGFNPIPQETEVKEWLCLNCQMLRAVGEVEPQGTPMMKPQPVANKVPATAARTIKDDTLKEDTTTLPMKDIPLPTPASTEETQAISKKIENQTNESSIPASLFTQDAPAPASVIVKEAQIPSPLRMKEEALVPAPTLIKEEAPVPASTLIKEEVPVPASTLIKEEVPVPASTLIKEEAPVPASTLIKEEVPVPAPTLIKEKVPVPAPGLPKEEVPVPSSTLIKEEVPVPASTLIKEKVPVPVPTLIKEEVPVPASGLPKVEVAVPAPGLPKEEVPVPASTLIKEEVPVPVQTLIKEEVPVPDPLLTKEEAPVPTPPLIKEEVPVPAPCLPKEEVTVTASALIDKEVPVPAPTLIKEEVPVPFPTLIKEEAPVLASALIKEEVPVPTPLLTKEDVPVPTPGLAKEDVLPRRRLLFLPHRRKAQS